jgi:hypothetical protein
MGGNAKQREGNDCPVFCNERASWTNWTNARKRTGTRATGLADLALTAV